MACAVDRRLMHLGRRDENAVVSAAAAASPSRLHHAGRSAVSSPVTAASFTRSAARDARLTVVLSSCRYLGL